MKKAYRELKTFLVLWSTQSLSQLGSAMTGFALTLWLYEKTGSALGTALLSICSYGPYVLMSVFAGTLCDRWDKKRTMLVCDALAACCSAAVLVLLRLDALRPGHLYVLNVVTGLMNTVQSPAGDVAMTLITPRAQYQRASALRSFSGSLVTLLHPVLAAALFALAGMEGVILVDLATFAAAALALALFVPIPAAGPDRTGGQSLLSSARAGLAWLRQNGLILTLILFMAGVNFVASAFDAALPAYVLSSPKGGERALGAVSSCAGLATLAGSLLAAALPPPKDRVRVIWRTALFSLGTENLILAFAGTPVWWCLAQIAGWSVVPVMNANLDVILRGTIPPAIQGRVYACRNTLQFFTIPLGLFAGGFLTDRVCGPLTADPDGALARLFGAGGAPGPALTMFLLGALGVAVCLAFRRPMGKYTYKE